MKKFDIFIAVLVTLFWGGSYIVIKYIVIEIPGLLSIAIRFIITSAILLPFVPRPKTKFRNIYSLALVMGVFYIGLLYYGLYLGMNASLTVIIAQLNIPISIIIARFALKEHFTLSSIIGVSLALIGVLIIVGAPQTIGNYTAFIMLLFSSLFAAIFNIQVRKLGELPPLSLLCWSNLIAAPHLLLISYFIEGNPLQLLEGTTYKAWIAISYTILITGSGVMLWFRLLQRYPIHKIMPFHLLTPFFGISLSVIFLGELPSWSVLLGGAVILSGVAITQTRILPLLINKRF